MFDKLLDRLNSREENIVVVGLGYVGLPLAVTLSSRFNVIGFDIDSGKVEKLKQGIDDTGEVEGERIINSGITITDDPSAISHARFVIVSVPTPIDAAKQPDLRPLLSASRTVGQNLAAGSVVVYESTVYPGATEEDCAPVLEKESGLERGKDYRLGYSPERVNPGDKEHTIERIVKVVSGEDDQTLEIVAGVYGAVITAGVHKAPSIKVAEAAKVIENIQRDLNIALMNELAVVFNLMGIETNAVLEAAGTKWNFLKFTPGLVGGHCIGVDPYYLTAKAEKMGYRPEVIMAGRRINDHMGEYVASQAVKLLIRAGKQPRGAKVAALGITFKENVPDIRNSRVPDIISELQEYGVEIFAHDPLADAEETMKEYGIKLLPLEDLKDMDGVIVAVAHNEFKKSGVNGICSMMKNGTGVVVDVKSAFKEQDFGPDIYYWNL